MTYSLYTGDCLDVLPTLPDNSIETVITDPPAGISFMSATWDSNKGGRDQWIEWLAAVLRECYRVTKPGGMLLCWAIPRTSHWTGLAIEQAGWEIRDQIYHLFGSGFPKSHDISKAIDKAAGAEREVVGWKQTPDGKNAIDRRPNNFNGEHAGWDRPWKHDRTKVELQGSLTAPATDAARQFDGWGTALKPAAEVWWLAMKPLDGTFAHNALEWGVAGLNIDGGRIGTEDTRSYRPPDSASFGKNGVYGAATGRNVTGSSNGRWPSNVILDEAAGAMLDQMSGERKSTARNPQTCVPNGRGMFAGGSYDDNTYADTGGASRFFYCAKASRREREGGLEGLPEKSMRPEDRQWGSHDIFNTPGNGRNTDNRPVTNHHPTVKPIALCRYLARLTKTPTGGTVLDPFMGSGSIGIGAIMEGRSFIGIELSAEYADIARRRIEHAASQARQLELGVG